MKCEQNSVRWKTDGQRVETDLTDKRKLTPKPAGFREDARNLPKPPPGQGRGNQQSAERSVQGGHNTEGWDESDRRSRMRPGSSPLEDSDLPPHSTAPQITKAKFKCYRQEMENKSLSVNKTDTEHQTMNYIK